MIMLICKATWEFLACFDENNRTKYLEFWLCLKLKFAMPLVQDTWHHFVVRREAVHTPLSSPGQLCIALF